MQTDILFFLKIYKDFLILQVAFFKLYQVLLTCKDQAQ